MEVGSGRSAIERERSGREGRTRVQLVVSPARGHPAPQCATLSPARAGAFSATSATMLDVITPLYLTDQWPLGAGKPVGVHAQGVPGVHLA